MPGAGWKGCRLFVDLAFTNAPGTPPALSPSWLRSPVFQMVQRQDRGGSWPWLTIWKRGMQAGELHGTWHKKKSLVLLRYCDLGALFHQLKLVTVESVLQWMKALWHCKVLLLEEKDAFKKQVLNYSGTMFLKINIYECYINWFTQREKCFENKGSN